MKNQFEDLTRRVIRSSIDWSGTGLRLDDYLAARFTYRSLDEWRERIARGEIMVNDAPARPEQILALHPQGVLLSNGPGDPADNTAVIQETARLFAAKIPMMGVCLGHQLITWALGGRTVKMTYGHHGGNQPVRDLDTGRSFVTAQNHNYMSDMTSLPKSVHLWFTNANDGTVEGLYDRERHVRSVQFHPEASPGPEDAHWIFDAFLGEIEK